ncbi:MaoC/PaaZ C-terminal domain-containing protein [Cellulomonas soli]|uniref:MaoC/PaaZ C-terminal domain-containing protein n=1 Tax=Cellulomonas soli TaxID=931535 RepID=UPI003F857CD0
MTADLDLPVGTPGHAPVVVELPGVPGLGGTYARGLATGGRLALARRTGSAPTTLADVRYVARGVRADADHLTAYQHLLGESGSDALPAGFVHVLAFPVAIALMARTDFPLPLLGVVHLSNRIEQHRPLLLGETFDLHAHAEGLRPHRAGTQVDLVTEAHADGAVVWRGVSTYLAKGVRLAGRAPDEPPREPFEPPVPTGQWRLDGDTGLRYAAVSGDVNPIHTSTLGAKALGFPRRIAHGMYTAARALADIGAARGDAFVWTVTFDKPVLLPGTIAVRVAREGDGFTFVGWHPRSGKPHLRGAVTPRRE